MIRNDNLFYGWTPFLTLTHDTDPPPLSWLGIDNTQTLTELMRLIKLLNNKMRIFLSSNDFGN